MDSPGQYFSFLEIDEEKCNNCGRCVGKCKFGCIDDGKYVNKVYIGGCWGKKVAHGQVLTKLMDSEEELMLTIEKTILFFREYGIAGERMSDTIARISFEKVNEKILGNEMIERKAEILAKEVLGGASC